MEIKAVRYNWYQSGTIPGGRNLTLAGRAKSEAEETARIEKCERDILVLKENVEKNLEEFKKKFKKMLVEQLTKFSDHLARSMSSGTGQEDFGGKIRGCNKESEEDIRKNKSEEEREENVKEKGKTKEQKIVKGEEGEREMEQEKAEGKNGEKKGEEGREVVAMVVAMVEAKKGVDLRKKREKEGKMEKNNSPEFWNRGGGHGGGGGDRGRSGGVDEDGGGGSGWSEVREDSKKSLGFGGGFRGGGVHGGGRWCGGLIRAVQCWVVERKEVVRAVQGWVVEMKEVVVSPPFNFFNLGSAEMLVNLKMKGTLFSIFLERSEKGKKSVKVDKDGLGYYMLCGITRFVLLKGSGPLSNLSCPKPIIMSPFLEFMNLEFGPKLKGELKDNFYASREEIC